MKGRGAVTAMCVCKCMRVCVRACVCACVTKETEGDSLGPLRSTTGFPLSKRSQYGLKRYANRLKRYANRLKRYANGASTASIYIQQAESVLCLCVRAISLCKVYMTSARFRFHLLTQATLLLALLTTAS